MTFPTHQNEVNRNSSETFPVEYRRPLISVLVPVYNVRPKWFEAALESVLEQKYENWEVCIVDDCSDDNAIRSCLANVLRLEDSRVHLRFLKERGGISRATNEALAIANGEYVAFLDDDDVLTADALFEVAKAINEHMAPDVIYSDEDLLTPDGTQVFRPHFKPNYSPALLLSHNYITHLLVVKSGLVQELGGLRYEFDGAQDYDLILRLTDHSYRTVHHIPKVLYHWRSSPISTSINPTAKPEAEENARKALESALTRRGIEGEARYGNRPHYFHVQRRISDEKVSILIPFKDKPALLRRCLDSILKRSTFSNYEIVAISNNSTLEQTFDLITKYAENERRLTLIEHNYPFNFPELINRGVECASGTQIVILNNDIEIISPVWLEALLQHSQRAKVGVVGGKLLYPDNTVQHAGIIVGIGGYAGHAHKYFPVENNGYFNRINIVQNVSAVTAAFMMCKRAVFEEVDGFDPAFPTACNDVDFCLRVREKGYLNIYTPYAEAYHLESASRGYEDTLGKQTRFKREKLSFQTRHRDVLTSGDPYYNRNLSLDAESFEISQSLAQEYSTESQQHSATLITTNTASYAPNAQRIQFEIYPKAKSRLEIGEGLAVVFSGHSTDVENRLNSLEIGFEGNWQEIQYLNEGREDLAVELTEDGDACPDVGFWGTYRIESTTPSRPITFAYRATFSDKSKEEGVLCDIALVHKVRYDLPEINLDRDDVPLIAICMTTFEPKEAFLKEQLESLQTQSYPNWYCIICDDNSSDEKLTMIERMCEDDRRFHLIRNKDNVGFYRNYERCLRYVSSETEYVAFSDQDDKWNPNKLERLLAEFDDDTSLVYSDMRLIDKDGAVLSETYWSSRVNNYTNLDVLLIANTITGAASLFRARLIDMVLPIPNRIGDAFYDHWVALVAFSVGKIKYVDEPLYDYRQHEGNVIGYSGLETEENSIGLWQALRSELKAFVKRPKIDRGNKSPPRARLESPDASLVSVVEIHNEESSLAQPPVEHVPVQAIPRDVPSEVNSKPLLKEILAIDRFLGFSFGSHTIVTSTRTDGSPYLPRSRLKVLIATNVILLHRLSILSAQLARYCIRYAVILLHHLILVSVNLARYCVRKVVIGTHHLILVSINLARHCVRKVVNGIHHLILMAIHWIRFLIQMTLHQLRHSNNLALLTLRKSRYGISHLLLFVVQRLGYRFVLTSRFNKYLDGQEHHRFHLEMFRNQCRSLELFSETLRIRFRNWNLEKDTLSSLNTFGQGRRSAKLLRKIGAQIRQDGHTTGDREIAMAHAYLANQLNKSPSGANSVVHRF